ncbi:MAG: hypothetical protein RBR68_16055 [Tenuifilaceae bacterium]|nr:hypothetical protein [Tenuifilaceae bacterium]
MLNLIIKKGLQWVGGKLDGYKTNIGGGVSVLYGLLGVVHIMFPSETQAIPNMSIDEIITYITLGISAIGLGYKLEKNTKALTTTNKPTE